MGIATGTWLAVIAGGITGGLSARLPGGRTSRQALIGHALLGGLLGALAYGLFLFAGFAVSLLTFSGTPDAGPAVLCVVLGGAAFLLLTWLQSVVGPRFGLPPREGSRPRRLDDLLNARASGGPATMWLGGVGMALLPLAYGLSCLVTRRGSLGTILWHNPVEGGGAIALGLGWIAMGAFLHFHFFFGLHPGLGAHSRAGKRVALIVACVGFTIAGIWSVVSATP